MTCPICLAHRMLREIGVNIHQWYKEEQDE